MDFDLMYKDIIYSSLIIYLSWNKDVYMLRWFSKIFCLPNFL